MKKVLFLMVALLAVFASCSDNDKVDGYKTYEVTVQVAYPAGHDWSLEGLAVKLTGTTSTSYDATTDSKGQAKFEVTPGIYEVSASTKQAAEGYSYVYNAVKSDLVVTDSWDSSSLVSIEFTESKSGQVIIKEIYVGGCPKNDGSGSWTKDKYIILYNNSDQTASLNNLCLGVVYPANAHAAQNDYDDSGNLRYENENFIPVGGAGYWYYPSEMTIEPYSQVVIPLYQAIDHTTTYTNSVDLSNSSYYPMYDLDNGFKNTTYYAAPNASIPTSNYFKSVYYGQGNAWVVSENSPAVVLFTIDGDPAAYGLTVENYYYYAQKENNAVYRCVKVPTDWILDGVEVFYEPSKADSKKRLTVAVDGGYTLLTNKLGHTSYRNVDQDATEALSENSGKLVYGYADDASGIDAEASIKNGAHIVYIDTNNSSNDFHQRTVASLKN